MNEEVERTPIFTDIKKKATHFQMFFCFSSLIYCL